MSEVLEFDEVDAVGAGAVGAPGQREFFLQARQRGTQLTVLLEKEQVAMLAREASEFLDRIDEEFPEETGEPPEDVDAVLEEPTVPLFRVRVIGIGFDARRRRVLLELREHPEEERADSGDDTPSAGLGEEESEDEGYIARVYATRAQVRAMCRRGELAVAAGRPPCPLCFRPMDPDGHTCPRWN